MKDTMNITEGMTSAHWVSGALGFIGGLLLDFAAPIALFILLIMVLLVFDFKVGVAAARCRGERISTEGWRRTIVKFVYYSIAVISARGIEYVFFTDVDLYFTEIEVVKITYAVALAICSIEFKSILDNIAEITGLNLWGSVKGFFTQKKD